jgi:hypothetical protein
LNDIRVSELAKLRLIILKFQVAHLEVMPMEMWNMVVKPSVRADGLGLTLFCNILGLSHVAGRHTLTEDLSIWRIAGNLCPVC